MIEIIKSLALGMAKHPNLTLKVTKVKSKVYNKVCDLDVSCLRSEEPIPYDELKNHTFEKITRGEKWADQKFGCAWFKIEGKVPKELSDRHPVIVFNVNGETLAYSDGNPFDITTTTAMGVADVFQAPTMGKRIFDLTGKTRDDGSFTIYADAGHNGINGIFLFKPKFVYSYLATKDDLVNDFYYDFLTASLLVAAEENTSLGSDTARKMVKLLDKGYSLFRKGDLVGAKNAIAPFYDNDSEMHRLVNDKINKTDRTTYTCVGHAHLDLAWLWPKRESVRKAMRTFTNAISMIEKNKDFVFGASQAQMYDWVRTENPALFEKIKKAVGDGNIEIQGGMWTECDCNLPNGESLIRQFQYGDDFFLEHFGKTSKTVWLPDVFGYPATLPQIIKGVGKENFATIKLTWNKTNPFPYQTFNWIAPDGSKVLAHLSPEGTYTNEGSPVTIAKSNRKNKQKDIGKALVIYGNGDGGGGAGEGHVEVVSRERKLYDEGKVNFGSAEGFFETISGEIPEYSGELYLEKHRGTYTSQSENKRLNRALENSLHTLEWLLALEKLNGSDGADKDIDDLWKTLLFNQFHDILPGSGIERVHRESRAELGTALNSTNDKIKALINKNNVVNPTFALNPSPFEQTVEVMIDGTPHSATVGAYSSQPLEKTEITTPSYSDKTLENNLVRVVFSKDGDITSYFDKVRGIEMAKGALGRFVIYLDKKLHYNAWDIDNDYILHPQKVKLTATKSYLDGLEAVVEHTYKYGESTIVERVKLGSSADITFDIDVDWKETHKMLRVEFEPTEFGDNVECDIQFGAINRVTHENDSVAKEQFEICAHKYIATSSHNIFALYSNSKYGYRAKNGKVSINLLRSPVYPDPTCDRMAHHITYKMALPHDRKDLVKGAYNFNLPAILCDRPVAPIVSTNNNSVIIETIKPSKNGDGITLRLYERYGAKAEVDLAINTDFNGLYETNLLENDEKECTTHLTFRPHEIKTILIKLPF